jgi:ABC-type spermidine/putrescine transport system permease subunit II
LERYIEQFPGKRHLLLLNKVPFTTPQHVSTCGLFLLFFQVPAPGPQN